MLQNPNFTDLFLSTEGLVKNTSLAKIYGVSSSNQWQILPAERTGILSRSAVLANGRNSASPILRGVEISRELLCNEISNPPAEVIDMREVGLDVRAHSTRDYVDIMTSRPLCMSCHSSINSYGHGLGEFDSIGRRTLTDRIFDTSGKLVASYVVNPKIELNLDGLSINTQSAREMSERISHSSQANQCFTKQLYRFFAGKKETKLTCGMKSVSSELATGKPILEMLENLIFVEIKSIN